MDYKEGLSMRLKDKIAMVVGAGSIRPGIGNGKATAILFAKEGAKVVAIDRNINAALETVDIIIRAGGEAIPVQADVSKELEAKRAVEAAIAKYSRIDVIFNNVGIGSGGRGLTVTEKEWDTVMNVNLKSILFICKYAIPEMIKTGGGTIVNNASMAAYYSYPTYAYAVSKAGVIALTRCLAGGYARNNIRVNCVAPGLMDTPMVSEIQTESRKASVERIPIKRQGRAEETAQTVLFLASDESSYITGQTIQVDGGQIIT
jgi:NAD(P)-dependent dehydrogenase (short-subunit alcohol dehydrogenase family)